MESNVSGWRVVISKRDFESSVVDMDGEPIAFELSATQAHLIGAAPKLLEVIKVLVDHAQEQYPHFESERGQRDIAAALAVIAKAEGRQ